jgi:hypothetical protein
MRFTFKRFTSARLKLLYYYKSELLYTISYDIMILSIDHAKYNLVILKKKQCTRSVFSKYVLNVNFRYQQKMYIKKYILILVMHCFLLKVSLAGKFIYLSRIECIFFFNFSAIWKTKNKTVHIK